jgi:hypothetical protein
MQAWKNLAEINGRTIMAMTGGRPPDGSRGEALRAGSNVVAID